MVWMISEHEETATACNDARLFLGNLIQDLRLCLKHVLGGEHIRLLTIFRQTGSAIDQPSADLSDALEVFPPSGLAAFQLLNLVGCEVKLFF